MANQLGSCWLMMVLVLAACGSPGKGTEQAGTTEVGQAPVFDAGLSDASSFMGQPLYTGLGDGGAGSFQPGIDASLAELGFHPCRALFDRMMNCPHLSEQHRAQIEVAAEQMEQAAADPKRREMIAASCLQMAKSADQQLAQMGC